MAEPGSLAERVKQQADIVRVIGEYVRLRKSGQNFTGLCPFHSERTPSFAVHPVKQIYHCFGCGAGGDVFKFVMEIERCEFPEALRTVAEKCGIALPQGRERSAQERREQSQRAALLELHREAALFFRRQLETTAEGKAARGYLQDRGLDAETMAAFGIGYAPSGGEALWRHLRAKFSEALAEASGLVWREASGRRYDRFRRRIMFPIANESGKIVAFGGRALGDDLPKYLNSPETPIYTKSGVLYHLDRAKEAMRQRDFAVLVEGYMDAIAVARAGVANVVASCGTSLTETQVRLLSRFTRKVIVNYDADNAGQAATERSLAVLLEQNCEARVLALPGGKDPDSYIRSEGGGAYAELLRKAPAYLDYLIARAQRGGTATAEEKLRAVNFLLPYVQRIPNALLRSEWASRISQQLRIEQPVLREALRRAARERRGELKPAGLALRPGQQAERRLLKMLLDGEELRPRLLTEIVREGLHKGLETEGIFAALISAAASGERIEVMAVAEGLEERERRILLEIAFKERAGGGWEEAESCLEVLRRRRAENELAAVQREIEAGAERRGEKVRELLARKQELRRRLAGAESR